MLRVALGLVLGAAASSKGVSPECPKVESPITATEGWTPASAPPLAMLTLAPMQTQV